MSNTWIELGLARPDHKAPLRAPELPSEERSPAATMSTGAAPLAKLAADLLALLASSVPDSHDLDTADFRRRLATYGARFLDGEPVTAALAEECLACCRAFLDRAHAQLAERETEFTELVGLLSEMVGTLGGKEEGFCTQLDRSTERLHRMVDINDIRILKRRLALEVETLKKLSEEKRSSDEALRSHYATEIDRLQIRLAQSIEEASLDQLTRIANRGRFERALQQWVGAHRTTGLPFVLAMVDVDNFKQINDTFGHPEGDRVLLEISRALAAGVRSTDLVARYGGDEFVIMLAHSTAGQALERVKTLIATLAAITVGQADSGFALTLSVGATEWSVEDEPQDLIARADAAMYQAKRAGKNRVEVVRRQARSRLFHNGRPVLASEDTSAPEEPSLLRRVR
jgi:diguanylate cyclase (GGDEF)-like protein